MINLEEYLRPGFNLEEVKIVNNIFKLTDDPNIKFDDSGESYIGYEHIGEYFSGKNKTLSKLELSIGTKIAEIVGDGVLLDVGCGDGYNTVAIARHGTKIIGGDISIKMLTLLQYRAQLNNVALDNVLLCRMNALNLPFKDDSVDCVIANSMLHLITKPKKVIEEIYRVLKKGGKFISIFDSPGVNTLSEAEINENKKYLDCLYDLDNRYWDIIKNEYKIQQKKLSWKFDKDKLCSEVFSEKRSLVWEFEKIINTIKLKDGYIYRHGGKGYSAQSAIPDEIHYKVFKQVLDEYEEANGTDFYDYEFKYIDNPIYEVNIYTK